MFETNQIRYFWFVFFFFFSCVLFCVTWNFDFRCHRNRFTFVSFYHNIVIYLNFIPNEIETLRVKRKHEETECETVKHLHTILSSRRINRKHINRIRISRDYRWFEISDIFTMVNLRQCVSDRNVLYIHEDGSLLRSQSVFLSLFQRFIKNKNQYLMTKFNTKFLLVTSTATTNRKIIYVIERRKKKENNNHFIVPNH